MVCETSVQSERSSVDASVVSRWHNYGAMRRCDSAATARIFDEIYDKVVLHR